jgi:membrane-associated protein
MNGFAQLIDVVLHLNKHLAHFSEIYGPWIYAILFLIIFSETGLVVTPFLPGDALLFTVGTLTAGNGSLSLPVTLVLLAAAAILGNLTNYAIGRTIGKKLYSNPTSRIFKQSHLEQTHEFFEKYGAKAIVLSRFLPLLRTMAPFVAGMGGMDLKKFHSYNILGAFLWVLGLVLLGHFFGNIEFVQKNFSVVILAIILISMIPPGIEIARAWIRNRTGERRARSRESTRIR